MEKQWISLANEHFPMEGTSLQGVKVDVLVSPYDIPEAVRGYLDEQQECFVIEFKYISSEPTIERAQDENVTLRVGRNSGRLYAIHLDVRKFNPSNVQLRLEVAEALRNVMTHLVQQPVSPLRTSNYKMAKTVIEDKKKELILQ